MLDRYVLHVADYSATFYSNFLSSLVRLQVPVERELGLKSAFVFPEAARDGIWVRQFIEAGIEVSFIDRAGSHWDRTRMLRRMARGQRAALYHSHFGTFDADVAYAGLSAGVPVVWHMHSPYPEAGTMRQRLGERAKFGLIARALVDRIIAVSPSVEQSALRHGAPASRFSVVLNAIDVDRAHSLSDPAREALRERYGIPAGEVVFLLFGWSPWRKGVDVLAEAARLLGPSMTGRARCLVVAGEANKEEVRSLAGSAVPIQVIPPVPDVAELYGVADCFVSASRAEGLPYAVGEAMAAGLPVIASDLPPVVEAYGPAGTGFAGFRTADPGDLARRMAEMIHLGLEERRRLGLANATFVRAHFSLERWAHQVVEVYRSVLARRA